MDFESGSQVGPYVLELRLGGGSFGSVWRAHESATGNIVAVKLLTGILASNERTDIRREVEVLAATASHDSPHVVRVLGGDAEPVPYIAMEFVDGTDLAARLHERGALSIDDTLQIGLAIADALAALSDAGIIHRDVKPANVLIDRAGTAKLADFGIAKIVGFETITMTGQLPMTMAYAAPEVWDGRATHQSDLYAMGVLLFQCLAGAPPFTGSYSSLFKQHTSAPPDLNALPAGTPSYLHELIRACLEKDPAGRPRDASQCVTLLRAAEAERTLPHIVEPSRFGPWVRGAPYFAQPHSWWCTHETSSDRAVVEVHAYVDPEGGAGLRRAVSANADLAELGAEQLLGTNRLLLNPGEGWRQPPAGGPAYFWIARRVMTSASAPDVVDAAMLSVAASGLFALARTAHAQGLALALNAETIAMHEDGSVHVRRPGLAQPEAAPTDEALAYLCDLPLDNESRAAVSTASNLESLASLPLRSEGSARSVAFGVAYPQTAADGSERDAEDTTIVQAPVPVIGPALEDAPAATIPTPADHRPFAAAEPPRRGWFRRGVPLARTYWYVGAGVAVLVVAAATTFAWTRGGGTSPHSVDPVEMAISRNATTPTPVRTATVATSTITNDHTASVPAVPPGSGPTPTAAPPVDAVAGASHAPADNSGVGFADNSASAAATPLRTEIVVIDPPVRATAEPAPTSSPPPTQAPPTVTPPAIPTSTVPPQVPPTPTPPPPTPTPPPPPPQPVLVVVDDLDGGFSRGGPGGPCASPGANDKNWNWCWQTTAYNGMPPYNGHYWYTWNNSGDSNSNWGQWVPNLVAPAAYRVCAYIPPDHAYTHRARYAVHSSGGVTQVSIDQQAFAGWADLGVYTFDAGSGGYVLLGDATGEAWATTQIGYDAMKWVPNAGGC